MPQRDSDRHRDRDDASSISDAEYVYELDDLPPTSTLLSDIERQDPLYSPGTSSLPSAPQSTLNTNAASVSASPQNSQRSRTAYLDGLRGIGAFLVYSAHHIPWFYGVGGDLENGFGYHGVHLFGQLPIVRLMFTGGNAAVAIFFVLSGYVLSIGGLGIMSLGQGSGAKGEVFRSLKSAMVRRPFRLFVPPVGISLVVLVLLQLPDAVRPKIQWPEPEPSLVKQLGHWFVETMHMMNPFVRHGVFETWYPYDPPAYTTAMEYQGSLMMFTALGVYCFLPAARMRMLALGVTGLVLLFAYQWAMAAFMFGAVLAANDLERYDSAGLQMLSAPAKAVLHHVTLLAGLYLLSEPAGARRDPEHSRSTFGWYYLTEAIPSNYYHNEWWRFWDVVGATFLVHSVLRIPWLQRLLLRPTIRYLGRISFSLYLVHIPILWTVADRVYRFFGTIQHKEMTTWFDNRFPLPDVGPRGLSTGYLAVQAVVLPITLLASELTTRWLDEPGVRFSRWLAGKLGLEKAKKKEGSAVLGHM